MNDLESQIAEWRSYVVNAPAVNGHDVDELEALRDQIADLGAAGLAADEAFLVAVKRMGDLDTLSRVRARAQRPAVEATRPERRRGSGGEHVRGMARGACVRMAAAIVIQVARLIAGFPDEQPAWLRAT